MIYLKLLPWVALVIAGATAWGLWDHLQTVKDQRDQAQAQLQARDANEVIVTKYVDKIVKVPGPAVVRERLVAGVCHNLELPSPDSPDAATGADPGDRRPDPAGALAADVAACQRNRLKLEALQEVLRPQVAPH